MTDVRNLSRCLLCLAPLVSLSIAQTTPPHLDGRHFTITALEEKGFLDVHDANGTLDFSGYLVDLIEGISREDRANFTYTLHTPSGYGSLCSPVLNESSSADAYDPKYQTQYNCGASDVNDLPLTNRSTEVYLGMYYVTPSRQLQNHFTLPFVPPFSGTLAMFGTATGIPTFDALVEQQEAGLQPAACAPGGTALIEFVQESYPGLQVEPLFGGEEEIYQAFDDGTCKVYIIDGPLAANFVLRRSQQEECIANGSPIGVIGEPMSFGLSHYAIGIRRDISQQVVNTLSYWMNILMSCNPLDPEGPCPEGNLATFYQGGTGSECGYVLYPPTDDSLSAGAIVGIVVASVLFVVVLFTAWHRYRLAREKRRYAKRSKVAVAQAKRERELNEFLAHEVRNPLSSAIAALSFVSLKTSDPAVVPNDENRALIKSDITVADTSLQFVSELLRNMLDIHRTTDKQMKLELTPTDIKRDVLEPVASILFMRGAKVEVLVECPENLIVKADRMRLKQIILNLAANSTKFVEEGYIRLRGEVINDNIYLYVEDSGPGIPPDKRDRLFAKFQESLDVLNQGTGIGLCVCKNLTVLMGADIFLDDKFDSGIPGCPGTRFTIRLNQAPLWIENGASEMEEKGETLIASKDLPEEMSVLFVDDDTMIRKMFVRSLGRVAPTWKIEEASNGETALRLVDDEMFDIIFIDQYMASVEKQLLGTETVSLLRAKGVTSIICGLSANDKELQFLDAGADFFMLKPFPCQKDALKIELLRLLDT